MIPIWNFAWQGLVPIREANPTVGDLVRLANRNDSALFVLHDPANRVSTLIVPEFIERVVNELRLADDVPAAQVGPLDLLRQRQLTAHPSQPASVVARISAWADADVVILVDDSALPVGLFMPSWAAVRIRRSSLLQSASPELRNTVDDYIIRGQLDEAIDAIDRELRDFHSEGMNLVAPEPLVCNGSNAPHTVSFCLCRRHPGATCGIRRIV